MQNTGMAYGDGISNVRRITLIGFMNHGEVLNIGFFSNPNGINISPQDTIEPDATFGSYRNIPNQFGSRSDKDTGVKLWLMK